MKTDENTLKDLQILSSSNSNLSIFKLFNKTQTEGGEKALAQIFTSPLEDVEEIIERQKTIKYIIENIQFWNLVFDNIKLKESWRYLRQQIIPVNPKNMIESFYFKFIDKVSYYGIYSGLMNFSNTLKSYESWVKKTFSENMPKELNILFIRILDFYKEETIQKLIQYSNKKYIPFYDLYKLDHYIRNELKEDAINYILFFYKIDAYLSLTNSIINNNFSFPIFTDCNGPTFDAVNLKHPFLKEPKKYSVSLYKKNNLIFLTGPNMAGKTTFLKACGIAVYLAHLGLAVPADKLELSYFTCLKSCINTEDDISLGYSYFYSEVLRVKNIAESVSSEISSFIIADEMFKGTNIHDAHDATEKVINGFLNFPNHIFLVSSHIVEVSESLILKNRIDCKCFDIEFKDEKIVYNYELRNGVSKTRLGINILNNENIFALLKLNSSASN